MSGTDRKAARDMAADPWLSVIMPIHHGARDLPATLESIAAQPTEGLEILVLDSSTDDSCRDVVERYETRLPLQYHSRPDMKPWPEKTNFGVQMARAPFIAMLHQDDLWLGNRRDALHRAIRSMGDAALHIAPALLVDEGGQRIGCWSPPLKQGIHAGAQVVERLLIQNFVAIPSPLIRRSAWLAVGGMDTDLWYTADWDLYLKLARQWPVAIGGKATTAFRIHARSLTMTGSGDETAFRDQFDIVLERHGAGVSRQTMRLAQASVAVNCALAAAAKGSKAAFLQAAAALIGLGPINLMRYLQVSRLAERLLPRARLWLAGTLR